MSNTDKIVNMFAAGIESGEGHPYKKYSGCNVYVDGRTIYSYGSHFPMAYIVAPNLVWFNGDRFSHTTNRHQSHVRAALSRTEAVVVIVPNTALEAAGLDYKTIAPVDVKPERWEFTPHSAMTPPAGMSTETTEIARHYSLDAKDYVTGPVAIEANYGTHSYSGSKPIVTMPNAVGWIASESGRQAVNRDPDTGEYLWHTPRHWLGDCVFTAHGVDKWNRATSQYTNTPRAHYVSSFDRQERRPLYFLSKLPNAVNTVEDAIESLSPDSVKTARELGREVVRQGDMFAIPMDVTRRELTKLGATFTKRKVTISLRPHAAQRVAQRDALESIIPTMPEYPKRRYFQCGQETHEEFDVWYKGWQADCDTWSDTLVSHYAERFPNLEPITRWSWQSALKYKPSTWDKSRESEGGALYGTAHTATEVATLPDGRQFATGTMYHDPAVIGQTRAADHARRKLGTAWHLVARNTVPVSGSGTGRRA